MKQFLADSVIQAFYDAVAFVKEYKTCIRHVKDCSNVKRLECKKGT